MLYGGNPVPKGDRREPVPYGGKVRVILKILRPDVSPVHISEVTHNLDLTLGLTRRVIFYYN